MRERTGERETRGECEVTGATRGAGHVCDAAGASCIELAARQACWIESTHARVVANGMLEDQRAKWTREQPASRSDFVTNPVRVNRGGFQEMIYDISG